MFKSMPSVNRNRLTSFFPILIMSFIRRLLKKCFKLFIYLAALGLNCSMWGLVSRPGIKCQPLALDHGVLATGPGEGNGNPLQYSCLENPRDRGSWWAAVCGVAQSRTRLKQLSSNSSSHWTTRKVPGGYLYNQSCS